MSSTPAANGPPEEREPLFRAALFISLPFREGVGLGFLIEADWSSASYWYEYIAIHGGELLLEGLTENSLQGDRIVADLYAEHFGVETEFIEDGALIRSVSPKDGLYSVSEAVCQPAGRSLIRQPKAVSLNFERIPDLYPAVALTCEKLSIDLIATGTDRLRFKESNRLEAVRLHEVRNDHRMAMALLAADFITLDTQSESTLNPQLDSGALTENDLQKIIAKSYPDFIANLRSITMVERRSNDSRNQC